MKLHWSPRSPFVRKVMVFAHEAGLVDRLTCVRTVVAMKTPNAALLPDNPLSKIPTLVLDDGSPLYDSGVICEYLDTLHDRPKLFPAMGSARWTALRRQALGDGFLDVLLLWRHERERPQPSQQLLDAFAEKYHATLTFLEQEASSLARAPFGKNCPGWSGSGGWGGATRVRRRHLGSPTGRGCDRCQGRSCRSAACRVDP